MKTSKTTAIIVPCYNEENRLDRQAFTDFIQSHSDFILCFVNDGSSDNTIAVLNEIKEARPKQVHVLDIPVNGGKAAAVRAGALYLEGSTHADYIGFIDADLSTDFQDFKGLVDTLESNDMLDVVYGSRNKGEGNGIDRNFLRAIFSNIVKAFIYLILRLPIEDTQCGAKVFRKKIVFKTFAMPFQTRWLFDVEIFIRLKRFYKPDNVMNHIYEQPLAKWIHVDDSKLGAKDAIQIPAKLMLIWYKYNLTGGLITQA